MGNDGGNTGTRNGCCSLLTSSGVGEVDVLSNGREEEGTAPVPLLVKNNGFKSMGDDGGYTGTRNRRCSLPSSSHLGEVGLLPSGREEEGTAPMPLVVENNRFESMGNYGGYTGTRN